MADGGKVDFDIDGVTRAVDAATDEFLTSIAFWVEGEAKVAMNLDTGFMRNATYSITPLANKRIAAEAEAKAAAEREMAPEPELKPGTAAVHGAAEYTIYQEANKPALYPALEKASSIAADAIKEAGRNHL